MFSCVVNVILKKLVWNIYEHTKKKYLGVPKVYTYLTRSSKSNKESYLFYLSRTKVRIEVSNKRWEEIKIRKKIWNENIDRNLSICTQNRNISCAFILCRWIIICYLQYNNIIVLSFFLLYSKKKRERKKEYKRRNIVIHPFIWIEQKGMT